MKRYLIPVALLAFAALIISPFAQTMRTVNDTNEMVMLNPQTINTNLFVHVMPPLKGSVWTFIAGDTTGPDTNHLDSVLYPGLGRWVWNNIGTNYFETLIVSNLVAGGDSLWTNLGGILQPQNLTLPVMLTNQLSLSQGMTNVFKQAGSDVTYTNTATNAIGSGIQIFDANNGGARVSSRGNVATLEPATGSATTYVQLRDSSSRVVKWVGARWLPGSSGYSVGGAGWGNLWDFYGTNYYTEGFSSGTGYSRMQVYQPGTNSPVIFDQQTLGESGYSRGFDFRTNGVSLFTVTGTGGPSSAANWTAVGATDSSLTGTASATNGFTTAEGGTIAFTNDVKLVRDGAANSLALRNGTAAQAFRVYNTWSNSGTDYERGTINWTDTPNSFTIGTKMGGTGQSRSLQFMQGGTNIFYIDAATGALLWNTDNTRDIGASGANRPKVIYAGSSINAPSVYMAGSGNLQWASRGNILAPNDGDFVLWNGAYNAYNSITAKDRKGGTTKVLTNSALSDFLWVSVPNTNAIGGKVVWTLTSTDGTDTQQITGETKFGAVAKLTAVTATLADVQCPAAIAGGGTLTAVIASNTTTNNVLALGVTPTSSLTTTNILFKWRLETPSTYTVNAL